MSSYAVMPMFWGTTFPHGTGNPFNSGVFPASTTPYTPDDFTAALTSIAGDGYFSKLHQYGAERVLTLPPVVSNDAWPRSDTAYYVATFTVGDVTSFIQRHMSEAKWPEGSIPIFAAIIPQGSVLDQGALGAHSTFKVGDQKFIWFWMYGSNNIHDACITATHEIAESIGADFGVPKELCDDCKTKNPDGRQMDSGLGVETYYDASTNTCVAPGSSWVTQRVGVGGGSSHGPALAALGDQLFAAWKGAGEDSRMFWSSFDGDRWAPQREGLGGGSSHGPALAALGDQLFAAWKGAGEDSRMFWSSFDGDRWAPQREGLGGGSSHGPALAALGDQLFAAWKGAGEDSRMFWSSFDGDRWAPQREGLGGGSSHGPALAALGDQLFAAWKGAGEDSRMFWSSFDGDRWAPQREGLGGGSSHGPALAALGDQLFAAWKGAGEDSRMFWSSFDGDRWAPQREGLGGGSSHGPALASFQELLYAAWKGAGFDQEMYWSTRS